VDRRSRLPDSVPEHTPAIASKLRWKALVYAGLGASTGLLTFLAALDFFDHVFDQVIALALSTLIIALFIEPLIERVTPSIHAHAHEGAPANWKRRALAFGALVAAALSHHLVDDIVSNSPWNAFGMMATAFVLPGGITVFWIMGAKRRPSRATSYGLMGAAIISGLFFFLVMVLSNGQMLIADDAGHISLADMPFTSAELGVIFNATPWIVCGLLGGMAVDRRWGKRPAIGVGRAIIIAMVAMEIAAKIFFPTLLFRAMGLDVARIVGWAAGLWLYVPCDALLSTSPMPSSAPVNNVPQSAKPEGEVIS
jgi:hypothetical protein